MEGARRKVKPTAYIVVGPESSGTRLVTRLLMSAGCSGDGDHNQRWDGVLPQATDAPQIVWRRSAPHGGAWPDLVDMMKRLRRNGYEEVKVIVTVRDWYALRRSQVMRGHRDEVDVCQGIIEKAYRHIFKGLLRTGLAYWFASYDALVSRPALAVEKLLRMVGLKPLKNYEPIEDRNARHYEAVKA